MRSRLALIELMVAAASLLGCHRAPELNVMHMESVCDSVPPPVRPGERIGAAIPTDVRAVPDSAIAVGTVMEMSTGRTLAGAAVTLRRDSAAGSAVARVYTNPSGGFRIASAPGTYALTVRLIGRPPTHQAVTLRAGLVDTLRLEMRYMRCLGY
jgi:hypothetical protein